MYIVLSLISRSYHPDPLKNSPIKKFSPHSLRSAVKNGLIFRIFIMADIWNYV